MARDLYHLPDHQTAHVLDLCQAMDEGYHEGSTLAYPGEPPPRKKKPKDPDPEPLELEEYFVPKMAAQDVVDLLDDGDVAELFVELNPGGRLRLGELLSSCSLTPLDVWPERQQNALARSIADRDARHLPAYFELLLERHGVDQAFENLTNPTAFRRAREGD